MEEIINNFAFKFGSDKHQIYSPLSIVYALSIVHQGANGKTERQLDSVFGGKYTVEELEKINKHFNDKKTSVSNVMVVNKDHPVKEKFLEMVSTITSISNEDFSKPSSQKLVCSKVNKFVETKTHSLIKKILDVDDISNPLTLLVIVNTVYFKSKWEKEFDTQATIKDFKFTSTLNPEKRIPKKIDMMCRTSHYEYFSSGKFQMVEVPYKNNEYVMGYILPLGKQFNKEINYLKDGLDCIPKLATRKVILKIPKFTQESTMVLNDKLKEMGMTYIFKKSPNRLTRICKDGVYVSKVIHKAIIINDEGGTEAAAATAVILTKRKGINLQPERLINFTADHTFVYYIRHTATNTLLFVGTFDGN
jgi:serine protease inhibitor